MEFTPAIKRPLGTMDLRIFRAEPMGLRRLLEERPIASRFELDPEREVLFINFAGLAIKGERDLRDISAAVEKVCAPLGRRSGQSSTTTGSACLRTWQTPTPSWSESSRSATTSG